MQPVSRPSPTQPTGLARVRAWQVASTKAVSLSPVLIRKGETKLALYGLGHVRDEELALALDRGSVKVSRAGEALQGGRPYRAGRAPPAARQSYQLHLSTCLETVSVSRQ